MNLFNLGMRSIGRLLFLAGMLCAFLFGMAAVVYMSLSGEEVRVPELVGRDFVESEKELAALGLKIKKRADRPSTEKINTILDQLPRPGETVKTGQMILVVVSKAGLTQDERPDSLKKDIEEDDTKKIEEMISDKPKRQRTNTNTNANANGNVSSTPKVADTARDVGSNSTTSSDTSAGEGPVRGDESNRRETPAANSTERPNRNTAPTATPRPQSSPAGARPAGDTRPRTTERP